MKKIITVAIHQPNFLPWLGYFYKIYAADKFIFHDNVQFTKSYVHRTQIRKERGSDETAWLIVPRVKHSDYELIKNIRLVKPVESWVNKQKRRLSSVYGKTPFFKKYANLFSSLFLTLARECDTLTQLNIRLNTWLADLIELKTKFYTSSTLPVEGQKSEYNAKLVEHVGGTVYLSGIGAKKYNVIEDFSSRGIKLEYIDYASHVQRNPYSQEGTYLAGLSVLDVLFNIGVEGITNYFKSQYKLESKSNSR